MPGAFIQNDLNALLSVADFATNATFNGDPVKGIFDNDDVEVPQGEGAVAIVKQCMFTGKTSDFLGIAVGDAMVINSVTYTVQDWMDDSTGMIEIILEPTS